MTTRSNITILLVEDLVDMRKVVRTILTQIGFRNVIEAPDGREALQILKTTPVDFVIADWNMPNLNGLDLLREMQGEIELKYIPFLMVTCETDEDAVLSAIQAGVTDYIIKPFSTSVLEKKIREIVAKSCS